MADIKPTRSELIKLKKKIKLAKSGHKLLKKKRDGLILEFFEVLKKAKTLRGELTQMYVESTNNLKKAEALDGVLEIKNASLILSERPSISLKTKNIMGVVVPEIDKNKVSGFEDRNFELIGMSSRIQDTAESFSKLLEKIITAAEVETTLRKLLEEVEKTKRRVNALEFKTIPELEKQQTFIKMRLEEMERENTFRLKTIKKKN